MMNTEAIFFMLLMMAYVCVLIFLNSKYKFSEKRLPEKYESLGKAVNSSAAVLVSILLAPPLLFILILAVIWLFFPETASRIADRILPR